VRACVRACVCVCVFNQQKTGFTHLTLFGYTLF